MPYQNKSGLAPHDDLWIIEKLDGIVEDYDTNKCSPQEAINHVFCVVKEFCDLHGISRAHKPSYKLRKEIFEIVTCICIQAVEDKTMKIEDALDRITSTSGALFYEDEANDWDRQAHGELLALEAQFILETRAPSI